MKTIAIANQKGGVGKTTTAINLSSALSKLERRVLLVDMDPQGNSGRGYGIDISVLKNTVFEVLSGKIDARQAISHHPNSNVDVLPSNLRLATLEASLLTHPSGAFKLLSDALRPLSEYYDYAIIDCPPSLGSLSLNALSAADSVIVPVQCEYFAMEAVGAILSSIANVQKRLNPHLKIEGFLLTMYDSRTALGNEISSQVRSLFKENTFLVSIPRNQSIVDSQASRLPVTEFRPSSAGAVSYFSLAREVIDHEER